MTAARLKLFCDWHRQLSLDLQREASGDVQILGWATRAELTAGEMQERLNRTHANEESNAMRRFDSAVTANRNTVWK